MQICDIEGFALLQAQMDPLWDDYAAEGDSPEECLKYKLTIKKKDSTATVKEITLAYIKRLRALGWYLHLQHERLELDRGALQSALNAEVQGRANDNAASLSRAGTLSAEIDSLKVRSAFAVYNMSRDLKTAWRT